MPIPAVISDLSPIIGTGPAPNGGQPGGGENPSTFDDYLRAYGAFIAQLRAGSGFANSGAFRIPFFDASGAWSSSADFVRDASGNVGVGVSPTARFHVFNPTQNAEYFRAGTGNAGREIRFSTFINNGTNDAGHLINAPGAPGDGALAFATNSTERMRIDASGHQINTPGSTTPPTLTANGQLNLTPTSNTNVRISFRGTDGVTRVANITLA
jgi:hypothetical protein